MRRTALLLIAVAVVLAPAAAAGGDDSLILLEHEGDRPYQAALHLMHQGERDDALVALAAAEVRHGPHPDIFATRARLELELGRLMEARRAAEAAVGLDREHLSAIAILGRLDALQGDSAGAGRALDRLAALCPFGCAQERELRRWLVASRS